MCPVLWQTWQIGRLWEEKEEEDPRPHPRKFRSFLDDKSQPAEEEEPPPPPPCEDPRPAKLAPTIERSTVGY